jgi:hypothetical protein
MRELRDATVWLSAAIQSHDRNLRSTKDDTASALYNSVQDCAVAMYLASRPAEYREYLASLPSDSNFLPRQWSESELKALRGSPLLIRVRKAREGIQKDYNLIREAWKEIHSSHSPSTTANFPKLEEFSSAMAVVSSRAFSGMAGFETKGGAVNDTTMIPLLDLCNHHRGRCVTKNVSYRFKDGTVMVKAVTDIAIGDTLKITYGAQGNAQLFLNYGFCVADNWEPDGSSNDALEFFRDANDLEPVAFLRTGPKSYTYGPFVKALESFRDDNAERKTEHDFVDLEAFLDECDDEGVDEEFDCCFVENDGVCVEGEDTKSSDIKLLEDFRTRLLAMQDDYVLNESSQTPFATTLIQSELRIIDFFLRAVVAIEKRLDVQDIQPLQSTIALKFIDESRARKQVDELAKVFMQIRHSGGLPS